MDENLWKRLALAIGWEYVQNAPAGYECRDYGNDQGWWKSPDGDWQCAKCNEFVQWDHETGPAIDMAVRLADRYDVNFHMSCNQQTKIWQMDFIKYQSFGRAIFQADKLIWRGQSPSLPEAICKAAEELLDWETNNDKDKIRKV